ncbi:MAG: hypothetical protein CMQ41_10915 [Gammaproteobacteria bacterium]|nr:hypothetical protein [Gammaproteobacteria bacterium]
MSLKVIELNDCGIKVGDESGIILESPGFALVTDDKVEVGESAKQHARLQPTNSFNKYWHELSLDPVSQSEKVRHYADLAYAQLLQLSEAAKIDKDVIFAVPGNFTRQQLSILLGLVQQCPFETIGLVDAALAASVSLAQSEHIVYADIQLHQVVVNKLTVIGDNVETGGVVQIPGVGYQNFINLMMQIATDMFIQQCRFNPQHNAESEQQLYNEIPSWLLQGETEKTLQLELKNAGATYVAKLPREALISALNDYYTKIVEQVQAMASTTNTQLLLSANLAELPGFQSAVKKFSNFSAVEEDLVNYACHQYRDLITCSGRAIHLVHKLPAESQHGEAYSDNKWESQSEHPTHALFSGRAIAIDRIEIKNKTKLNGSFQVGAAIVMNIESLPESLGRIEKRGEQVYLNTDELEVFLNDYPVTGERLLSLGDRICFIKSGEEISLIQVSDG